MKVSVILPALSYIFCYKIVLMVLTCCYRYVKFTIMENKNSKEIIEFINKLDELCWQYKIEIKPTNPVPNDELPTISIINGDEVVKLVYIDGDGNFI